MSALLRSQALGAGVGAPGQSVAGPASGPLSLAARRSTPGGLRPKLGNMGMGASAPGGIGGRAGIGGRRLGPPGGLTLSGIMGGPAGKPEGGNKFTDFGKIV